MALTGNHLPGDPDHHLDHNAIDTLVVTTLPNDIAGKVSLSGAETIAGVKTFSSTPVVPDGSFGVAKLSATGTRDSTTFLRGDNTWQTVSTTPPANMVTTDGVQTISAAKTFSANLTGTDKFTLTANKSSLTALASGASANSLVMTTHQDASVLGHAIFSIGAANDTRTIKFGTQSGTDFSTSTFNSILTINTNGNVTAHTALYEGSNRVYSAGNKPTAANATSATGTASATTFLAGDNTWKTALTSAPSNMVTTDSAQSITALKTLSFAATTNALQVSPNTAATSGTTTVNSPVITFTTNRWTGTATAAETLTIQAVRTSATAADHYINVNGAFQATTLREGVNRVYSAGNKPTAANATSATGTASATTFLAGDNTWKTALTSAPSNMATTDTTQTITGVKTYSNGVKASSIQSITGDLILKDDTGAGRVYVNIYGFTGTAVYDSNGGGTSERVYSLHNKVPVAGISATGTASATTYLRGDGTWSTVSAGSFAGEPQIGTADNSSDAVFGHSGTILGLTSATYLAHNMRYNGTAWTGITANNPTGIISVGNSGAIEFFAGTTPGTAGATVTPTLSARIKSDATAEFTHLRVGTLASPATGQVWLNAGSTSMTGYVSFVAANGNRQGYIGWSPGTGTGDSGVIEYMGSGHKFYGNAYIELGPNTAYSTFLRLGGDSNASTSTRGHIFTSNGNLHIDPSTGWYGTYLNWWAGSNGVYFGNGAGVQVGRVDMSGNASFSGTATFSGGSSNGKFTITRNSSGTGWADAGLEISDTYMPRIAFHQPGAVASAIGQHDNSEALRTFNNGGGGYADFYAANIYRNGSVVAYETHAHTSLNGGQWLKFEGNNPSGYIAGYIIRGYGQWYVSNDSTSTDGSNLSNINVSQELYVWAPAARSSRKVKTDIVDSPILPGLAEIKSAKIKKFKYNFKPEQEVTGLIAEEIPDSMKRRNPNYNPEDPTDSPWLIQLDDIMYANMKATQELAAEVEALRAEIERLKK